MNIEDIVQLNGDCFEIKGRVGKCYYGKLKSMMTREQILNLPIVIMNDKSYQITGVESYCIPDPIRAGTIVGLLLVKIPGVQL